MAPFYPPGTSSVSRIRMVALLVFFIMMFLLYIGYLFSLQIVDGYFYSMRSEQVTQRSSVIPAVRGQIFDRHYDEPLVVNVDSFAVYINPFNIPRGEHDAVFERLASFLSISAAEIHRRVPTSRYGVYQPIEIQGGVPYDRITGLAERIDAFPGVFWESKPVRRYVNGDSMAHILGYVGDITPEELQVLYNRGYTANSVLGKSGIEQQYDQLLRGADGRRFRMVDARGRQVGEGSRDDIPPELGNNLVLTIDRTIQQLSEKALGERIGSVVVLRPHTGEVLALVSYPRYDANVFSTTDRSRAFSQLSVDRRAPFLNRAIQSSASPASSFKVVMTAALLEEKTFSPTQTINCTGSRAYGNRVFNCHVSYGHGSLNLYQGLAQSCNIYYYTVGTDYLGERNIINYARRLGLGQRSGIDLPGEVAGLVPSPEWKVDTFQTPWVGGDTVNLSIGQGFIEATSLQMANMVAMIVNDGVLYRPHILKQVRNPITGQIIHEIEPEVAQTAEMSRETFEETRRAMREVITNGTANVVITTRAVEVAGKTGTGQTGVEERLHSWFVAYAPYNSQNPEDQVVVVVMVDAANDWEWWAPKAANIIIHGILTNQDFEHTIRSLRPLWYL